MKAIHFFAGANTARGFYSCFEDVLPRGERRRMYYLKGGPGVGKSTLMRRVGERAEAAGLRVEYFHCSSDPDSLDAVSLPERGAALMDGTAPHVYDPQVPGARDTLLSLGDFLCEAALRPHAREIERLQGEISARFARCYHYLAAAREVLLSARRGGENEKKVAALAAKWSERLPLRGGAGSVRRLFASAYTPKGRVDAMAVADGERLVFLDCPLGQHATGLMRAMSAAAAARGLRVIELLNPLSPEEIEQVALPDHGLRFACVTRGSAWASADTGEIEWLDAQSAFDFGEAPDKEGSFDRNAHELMLQRAIEQLRAAKALHDELEGFYAGNMDFLRWQGVLDRVLEELELGDGGGMRNEGVKGEE